MHQFVHFLHQLMVEIKEIEINSVQRSGTPLPFGGHPKIFSSPFWPTHNNFCRHPWRDDNSTCKAARLSGKHTLYKHVLHIGTSLLRPPWHLMPKTIEKETDTDENAVGRVTWTKRRVVTLTAVERSQTFIASKKKLQNNRLRVYLACPLMMSRDALNNVSKPWQPRWSLCRWSSDMKALRFKDRNSQPSALIWK